MRGIQAIERTVLISSNVRMFVDGVGGLSGGTGGWDRHLLRRSRGIGEGYCAGRSTANKTQFRRNYERDNEDREEREIYEETRERREKKRS